MSASPGDPQPVFDLIVDRARDLCDAYGATVFEFDGTRIHWRAATGVSDDPAVRAAYEAQFPMVPTRDWHFGRAILDRRIIRIDDHESEPGLHPTLRGITAKSNVTIPIMRGDAVIGAIGMGRREKGGFSDSQVELLKTFAEQAAIAITSAETYRTLQARTADLLQSLEYQTATSDVLKVISRAAFDLRPVFDTIVATAARLCNAGYANITTRVGDVFRGVAEVGLRSGEPTMADRVFSLDRETVTGRVALAKQVIEVADIAADPEYVLTEDARRSGVGTVLGVPLMRGDFVVGTLNLGRRMVQPFTDQQIELVRTFADQAVIAIENARLLGELREALERQTATAEVLRIINENPGNLGPVFDMILEKALSLAEAAFGTLWIYHGDTMHAGATRGMTPALAEFRARNPVLALPPVAREASETRRAVQMLDIRESESYRAGRRASRAIADLGGARTNLVVPLLKDNESVGCIQIYRQEVRVFTPQQISLLEGFAAQAVIAMDNARLLNEIRRRQNELDITFENMGDGVAMFDRDHRLAAWNRNFQDILDLPDDSVRVGLPFVDYIRGLAARGEYGPDANADEQIARLTMAVGQANRFERTRPNGRVIDVRHNPIQDGGFVVIYADITERKRAEEALRVARDEAETALRELKVAQANLVQAEKMASLGQVTAGIAHEIKNPLNFVNNFASLSVDLLDELKQVAAPALVTLADDTRTEIEELTATLTGNLAKIEEHGKRADGIVKAMLDHSRGASGERRAVDINALADEALNLAYHGARAQDPNFNITLERDLGDGIAPIEMNPQDITRVLLNLFSNGFYAANKRTRSHADGAFRPTLKLTTRAVGDAAEIRVRDNGTGIPKDIRDKLFQPFFTTKPTGEGTGLGLSITHDIVTKARAGTISVDSEVGEFTEFVVTLPRRMFTGGRSAG